MKSTYKQSFLERFKTKLIKTIKKYNDFMGSLKLEEVYKNMGMGPKQAF